MSLRIIDCDPVDFLILVALNLSEVIKLTTRKGPILREWIDGLLSQGALILLGISGPNRVLIGRKSGLSVLGLVTSPSQLLVVVRLKIVLSLRFQFVLSLCIRRSDIENLRVVFEQKLNVLHRLVFRLLFQLLKTRKTLESAKILFVILCIYNIIKIFLYREPTHFLVQLMLLNFTLASLDLELI